MFGWLELTDSSGEVTTLHRFLCALAVLLVSCLTDTTLPSAAAATLRAALALLQSPQPFAEICTRSRWLNLTSGRFAIQFEAAWVPLPSVPFEQTMNYSALCYRSFRTASY